MINGGQGFICCWRLYNGDSWATSRRVRRDQQELFRHEPERTAPGRKSGSWCPTRGNGWGQPWGHPDRATWGHYGPLWATTGQAGATSRHPHRHYRLHRSCHRHRTLDRHVGTIRYVLHCLACEVGVSDSSSVGVLMAERRSHLKKRTARIN